jgi:hypothetical protein
MLYPPAIILTRRNNIVYLAGKNGFHARLSIRFGTLKRLVRCKQSDDDDLGGRAMCAI